MSGRARFDLDVERRLAQFRRSLGGDLRRLLLDTGIPQARLAASAGLSPAMVSRVLRGERDPSIETIVRLVEAAGADLSVRLVPGAGLPIHDSIQARMVETFLGEVHPRWAVFLEVPVRTPARGSIDVALGDRGGMDLVASEFQSLLRRAEQTIRWSNEKADALRGTDLYAMAKGAAGLDGRPRISRLLVLRSCASVREVIRGLRATFEAAYPAPAEAAVAALREGTPWPGSAIVWMDVRGRRTHLMDGPPRSLRGA